MQNDDLHLLDDVFEELQGKAIRTSAGSFFKEEDVKRLIERRKAALEVTEAAADPPKTVEAARRQAGKFLKDAIKEQHLREPGRSVSATEPQPPSRA